MTVAVWFHGLSVVASVLPLSLGYPSQAVLPGWKDCLLLGVISLLSFFNQIVLNRGFQLEAAVKASAVNYYTQVSKLVSSLVCCALQYVSWFRDASRCKVCHTDQTC